MVELKICEVSVDVGVGTTFSVAVCIFGTSGVLVEWIKVEISVDTEVDSIVTVGVSVVGCIVGTCDEIRALVETENWFEVEASVDNGVDSIVEVGVSVVVCIFGTCDEIRALVETETWVEVEASVGTGVDSTVDVGDSVVGCGEMRVLVETETWVEVEASVGTGADSTVEVGASVVVGCDEIRVLVETGEAEVFVEVGSGRNDASVKVEASDETGPCIEIELLIDTGVDVVCISETSAEVETDIPVGLLVMFICSTWTVTVIGLTPSTGSGRDTTLLHFGAFSIVNSICQ